MPSKRRRPIVDPPDSLSSKRIRLCPPRFGDDVVPSEPISKTDILSKLSDELLLRVIHHLSIWDILQIQLVSKRFKRLGRDRMVWKGLFLGRWVGRRGRGVDLGNLNSVDGNEGRDWLALYRLRHNWRRGAATVREIGLGIDFDICDGAETDMEIWETSRNAGQHFADELNMNAAEYGAPELGSVEGGFPACQSEDDGLLVGLIDGRVITVDRQGGLRAWEVRKRNLENEGRNLIAQCGLGSQFDDSPTSLGVDYSSDREISVVVGFGTGAYGIWILRLPVEDVLEEKSNGKFEMVIRSVGSRLKDAKLGAVAYTHPYLLTINQAQVLSLYVFDGKTGNEADSEGGTNKVQVTDSSKLNKSTADAPTSSAIAQPRLLSSLKSHTSWPPLTLSIRSTPASIIASIAYALPAYPNSWSVGLQELHLTPSGTISRSRLASATKVGFHSLLSSPSTNGPSSQPLNSRGQVTTSRPTSLSYSHPYLLVSHPDNTLMLYLVTSNNEALTISKGTTLWGHTSGVEGAHVGGRGRAVSVSGRGEELRVWELEPAGRSGAERSVRVLGGKEGAGRRGWVGFDEEVVVVLRDGAGPATAMGSSGDKALVVYDFT